MQKTMGYNVNRQLASLGWGEPLRYRSHRLRHGHPIHLFVDTEQRADHAGVDTLSGETISYQYDALKRLTSASSSSDQRKFPGGLDADVPVRWIRESDGEGAERDVDADCGECGDEPSVEREL